MNLKHAGTASLPVGLRISLLAFVCFATTTDIRAQEPKGPAGESPAEREAPTVRVAGVDGVR